MALARRSNVPTNFGGSASINVDKPSNQLEGDLTFVLIGTDTVGLTKVDAPIGFDMLASLPNSAVGGGQSLWLFCKYAGPAEPAQYVFTLNTSSGFAVACWSVYDDTGLTVEPYKPAAADDAAGSTQTSPAIATEEAGDLVYSGFVQDQTASAGSYAASAPGGATLIANAWDTASLTYTGTGVQEEVRAAAGSGSHNVTQLTGGDNTRGTATCVVGVRCRRHSVGNRNSMALRRRIISSYLAYRGDDTRMFQVTGNTPTSLPPTPVLPAPGRAMRPLIVR